MPALELVTFTASEAFTQDLLVHRKALEILARVADGFLSAHSGLQTEDGKIGYFLIFWESYEHHKAFTQHPEYTDAVVEFRRAIDPSSVTSMEHVVFEGAYLQALISPATEIVQITPHLDKSEEAKVHLGKLVAELEKTQGCYSPFHGESKENPGKWVVIIGWDSVERHWEAVKAPVLQEYIGGLRRTTDLGLKHTLLTKFAS